MSQVYTIKKLAISDKWIEYWFEESPVRYTDELDNDYKPTGNKVIDEGYNHCSKTYMFQNILEAAGIDPYNDLSSCIGLKMTFDKIGHPEKIITPNEVEITGMKWIKKGTEPKDTWILTVKGLNTEEPTYQIGTKTRAGFCTESDWSGNYTFDYWTYLPKSPSLK